MLTQITKFFVFSLVLLSTAVLDAKVHTRRSTKPLMEFDDNAGMPKKHRTRRAATPAPQLPAAPIAAASTVEESLSRIEAEAQEDIELLLQRNFAILTMQTFANTRAQHIPLHEEATHEEHETAHALGTEASNRVANAILDGSITTQDELAQAVTDEAEVASHTLKQPAQNTFSHCFSRCLARWNKPTNK